MAHTMLVPCFSFTQKINVKVKEPSCFSFKAENFISNLIYSVRNIHCGNNVSMTLLFMSQFCGDCEKSLWGLVKVKNNHRSFQDRRVMKRKGVGEEGKKTRHYFSVHGDISTSSPPK